MPLRVARIVLWISGFAALPHASRSVTLDAHGIGEVLIYPYYTVRAGHDTLISVTNRAEISKAVQVRLLEGYNGRETLSFVLYLSPRDVWTATLTAAPDGGTLLRTADASCTSPPIPAAGIELRSEAYDGTGALPADGGPRGIDRTREGSIEFIAGADIVPSSATDHAITHVQDGTPNGGRPTDCGAVSTSGLLRDIVAPTSGLFGSGTIIDVGRGTFFAYEATALGDFSDVPLFSASRASGPTLADARSADASAGEGAIAYVDDSDGHRRAIEYERGIDAVSAVLMADTVENDYLVDPALGADTDWIVTFPTKRFYVDADAYADVPAPPFVEAFGASESGASNIVYDATVHDREENSTHTPGPDDCGFICPFMPPLATLSLEVNDLMFLAGGTGNGTPSGVFGSRLGSNLGIISSVGGLGSPPDGVALFSRAGWVSLDLAPRTEITHVLPGGKTQDGEPVTIAGLPVTGFMAYDVVNANAQQGVLANYGGTFGHHTIATICDSGDPCALR